MSDTWKEVKYFSGMTEFVNIEKFKEWLDDIMEKNNYDF